MVHEGCPYRVLLPEYTCVPDFVPGIYVGILLFVHEGCPYRILLSKYTCVPAFVSGRIESLADRCRSACVYEKHVIAHTLLVYSFL